MNNKYLAVAARMRGPLAPILVPFTVSEEVDYQSLAGWIDWMGQNQVPVMWTTGGTSEMMSLTEDEIFKVTKTIAEANHGRVFFIASTGPSWPASKCVEFVRFAKDCGVDAVKVQINWQGGPKPDGIMKFYGQVAEATDLPLLAYTVGQPGMTVDLLLRIIEAYPQFIGIKNDTDDEYRQSEYLSAVPPGFGIVTGGMMRPFVLGYQFGQRCYADSYATYKPSVALEFFAKMESGRLFEAIEHIKKYELPWSDLTFLGRHKLDAKATMKSILWLTGRFATNQMRFPRTRQAVDGPEIGIIREFLSGVGVEV